MTKEVIEVKAMVTINPDSQTYYLRIADEKGRITKNSTRLQANQFLQALNNAIDELSQGDEYYPSADLNAGDVFTLRLEIERKDKNEK
ncbi:hypothetical protein SP15_229 [Bacillus phage SP-15]|uniref:Uncharacterized protein n=1 Tax=Bacillus phage SP-15 TaxID=1792032 RepID=A0A127AZ22_9CAUD|nr:hypothetical protein SP15_229 [Bacillus phage SP-15]AMM45031.1 hypothetical protein SP15_229 [Bacillus phage SP-15]